VEDEEPNQFSKQCRLTPGMNQSGYFDLLDRQMNSKTCDSTWRS